MKINIWYELKDGPWGGGNQFLKSLRNYFLRIGVNEENPEKADVILFNSHHDIEKLILFKKKFPNKILIHRVDGPIFKIRNKDILIDKIIYLSNNFFSDGTIFQSYWSREMNHKLGMKVNKNEVVVLNAPDPQIFNKDSKLSFKSNKKISLVATSWSDNWRKGFGIYKFLDDNLDFSKFEMTFIGNTPVEFSNILHIKPLNSRDLAVFLKKSDIFLTASQSDTCSNSLIEALHCGLPAVVLNDGGHPEIIKGAGEVFNNADDIINKIEKVSENYCIYQEKINVPNINDVGDSYFEFIKNVFDKYQLGDYRVKKLKLFKFIYIYVIIFFVNLKKKIIKCLK